MFNTIKYIIFDLDGTIADTHKDIIFSINYALKKHNIKKKITTKLFKKVANYGSVKLFEKILPNYNKSLVYKINNSFISCYRKNICVESKLKKNFLFFINNSRKKNIKFFISTNKKSKIAKILLTKLKVLKYFKFVAGSDSFKYKKPNERHLQLLFKRFKLLKKNSVYIGDTEVDSMMARKFGIKFILIKNGYTNLGYKKIFYDILAYDYKILYRILQKSN